jgi:hypothetical protein
MMQIVEVLYAAHLPPMLSKSGDRSAAFVRNSVRRVGPISAKSGYIGKPDFGEIGYGCVAVVIGR